MQSDNVITMFLLHLRSAGVDQVPADLVIFASANHWKNKMSTLSSLVAPDVVAVTIYGDTSDNNQRWYHDDYWSVFSDWDRLINFET